MVQVLTPDYTIKRGDTGRVITGTFSDASGVIDMSGSTSRKLFMINLATGAIKINGVDFTITTSTWSYAMQAADVNEVAWFKLELEVVKTGVTTTFPTSYGTPYKLVRVQDDLG